MGADLSRRSLLRAVTVAALAVTLTPPGLAAPELAHDLDELTLWRVLDGTPIGVPFYEGWTVIDAYPPMAGGLTLVVADGIEGDPYRVDVVRRGALVRAAAYTDHLELIVMDGSDGDGTLDAGLVRALKVLVHDLGDEAVQARLARRLLTHDERLDRHPRFMRRAGTDLAPTPPWATASADGDVH